MMSCRFVASLLLLAAALNAWAQSNTPPKVEIVAPKAVAPGAEFTAQAKVTFAPGLHAYQNPPSEDYVIPVEASVDAPFKLIKAIYPKGEDLQVGGADKPIKMYTGSITIELHLSAPASAGKSKLKVAIHYQQCNATSCFAPSTAASTADLIVEGASTAPKPPPTVAKTAPKNGDKPNGTKLEKPTADTAAPAPGVKVETPSVATTKGPAMVQTPIQSTAKPSSETQNPKSEIQDQKEPPSGLAGLIENAFQAHNFWLILPLLFLAGLAINLTPCVYPMIPITLGFFANQSAGSRGGRLSLGFMYMLGIAVTYGALGGVAATFGSTFGALFENRWFLIALGVLMVALALSMFDVYQIGIPAPIARQIKGRSGIVGALIMGLLVGVAAAPCAGPLVVAILAEIAKLKSVGGGIGLFVMVGLGLGLPYMVLGAVSSGAKALPKSGGWMKTVKALLGLLVIGLGVSYFVQAFGRELGPVNSIYVWLGFYFLSAIYLLAFENAGATRAIFGIKGVAVLFLGYLAGVAVMDAKEQGSFRIDSGTSRTLFSQRVNWQPFTPESFEAAKNSGKVIVIDGAANWCVQCHELDDRVFEKPEAISAMRDVVALKIDWSTGVDPKYKDMTAKVFDIKGLPHVEILKPGGERSEARDTIKDPQDLIQLLKKAGAKL